MFLKTKLQVMVAVDKHMSQYSVDKCITSNEAVNYPYHLRQWRVTKYNKYICFKY